MFHIMGDVIYYEYRPVAIITVPTSTLRYEFLDDLGAYKDEMDELREELNDVESELNDANGRIDEVLKYLETSEELDVKKIIEILS